jgi:hypothetical protein
MNTLNAQLRPRPAFAAIRTYHTPDAIYREPIGRIGRHMEWKTSFRFASACPMAGSEAPRGGTSMPAQEPKPKRNFIAILSDKLEEPRIVQPPTKSASLVSRIFLGLMAALRNRTAKAK